MTQKKQISPLVLIIIPLTLLLYGCTNTGSKETYIPKESNETNQSEIIFKKPAIYLYPTKTQKIKVSLLINGSITTSIPKYNNGWNVMVNSNGLIENKYDYLFYENTLKYIELPKNGWIKEYKELAIWFDNILPKLGLNQKEKEQFKEYWLKELKEGQNYEIKLLSHNFINKNLSLNINPKPDSIIRVHLHFKIIDKKYQLKEPSILTPKRFGFTVVEWGGIVEE